MKQGERPPKGVRELVLRLAGRDPRPTNRVIQQRIKEKFEVTVDQKTIQRYCKAAGLPTSPRAPGERGVEDDRLRRRWAWGVVRKLSCVRLEALGPFELDQSDLRKVEHLLTVSEDENQRPVARFWFEDGDYYDRLLSEVPGLAASLDECRKQAVAYRKLTHARAGQPDKWTRGARAWRTRFTKAFYKARNQAREAIRRHLQTSPPAS